jgi:hypothetical protein
MESSTSDLISAQVALSKKKSMGMALILVLFFGPVGLLYSSVLGGLVLLGLPVCLLILATSIGSHMGNTQAAGSLIALVFVLLIPEWIVSLIWAAIAVSGHNRRIERKILQKTTQHS